MVGSINLGFKNQNINENNVLESTNIRKNSNLENKDRDTNIKTKVNKIQN